MVGGEQAGELRSSTLIKRNKKVRDARKTTQSCRTRAAGKHIEARTHLQRRQTGWQGGRHKANRQTEGSDKDRRETRNLKTNWTNKMTRHRWDNTMAGRRIIVWGDGHSRTHRRRTRLRWKQETENQKQSNALVKKRETPRIRIEN